MPDSNDNNSNNDERSSKDAKDTGARAGGSQDPSSSSSFTDYQFFTPNLNYSFFVEGAASTVSEAANGVLSGQAESTRSYSMAADYLKELSNAPSHLSAAPSASVPAPVLAPTPLPTPSVPVSSPTPPAPTGSVAFTARVSPAGEKPPPQSAPPVSAPASAENWQVVADETDPADKVFHPKVSSDAFEDRYKQRTQLEEQARLLAEKQERMRLEEEERLQWAEQQRREWEEHQRLQLQEQQRLQADEQRRQQAEEQQRLMATEQQAEQDKQFKLVEAKGEQARSSAPTLDFETSLMRIFWRVDINKNNRVNAAELLYAIKHKWFSGFEDELARAILHSYESIAYADPHNDTGLSVEQILKYPAFANLKYLQDGSSDPGSFGAEARDNARDASKPVNPQVLEKTGVIFKKSRNLQ